MSYLTGVPERRVSGIAATMHNDYCMDGTHSPLHYVPCLMMTCGECSADEGLYRVCPGCGDQLLHDPANLYKCSCETVIWICFDNNGSPIVTRYTTPNPLFAIKEDII